MLHRPRGMLHIRFQLTKQQMKSPRKWRKCNLVSGDRFCGQRHELAMNCVDRSCTSADERMLSGRRAVVIVWWAVAGVWLFFIDPSFLVNSHLGHSSGLDSCVLTYCDSAAPLLSLQSFYNYARGHCEAARNFFRVVHSVVYQCGTVKSRPPKMRGPLTVLGYDGKREWGFEGYWCLRKCVHWSPSIGGAKCNWLRRTKEKCQTSCVCISSLRGRYCAVVPGVLVFVHMCVLYVCVYICVCVYVCGHVYMYAYACVYVFVYVCVYTHVYVYVYAYLYINCGSQYQCFSVWTVSCTHMCIRVHMYAYAHVCKYIYMCFFLQWVLHALWNRCFGTSAWAGVYVTQVYFLHQRTHLRTHSLQVVHLCVCVCICMHMHMDAYVRLWYCLTRWGVVARIFNLCIRVHMHAYSYVCACMCV